MTPPATSHDRNKSRCHIGKQRLMSCRATTNKQGKCIRRHQTSGLVDRLLPMQKKDSRSNPAGITFSAVGSSKTTALVVRPQRLTESTYNDVHSAEISQWTSCAGRRVVYARHSNQCVAPDSSHVHCGLFSLPYWILRHPPLYARLRLDISIGKPWIYSGACPSSHL